MLSALWINWDEVFNGNKKNKEITKLNQLIANETNDDVIASYRFRIELVDKLLSWKDYKSYH